MSLTDMHIAWPPLPAENLQWMYYEVLFLVKKNLKEEFKMQIGSESGRSRGTAPTIRRNDRAVSAQAQISTYFRQPLFWRRPGAPEQLDIPRVCVV